MPVNGFVPGKRVWVELLWGGMRADFIGVIGALNEMPGGNYHVEFRGGFSLSFNQTDLKLGRIIVHDHDLDPEVANFRRRKTDHGPERK
jgi:hypothetical protein